MSLNIRKINIQGKKYGFYSILGGVGKLDEVDQEDLDTRKDETVAHVQDIEDLEFGTPCRNYTEARFLQLAKFRLQTTEAALVLGLRPRQLTKPTKTLMAKFVRKTQIPLWRSICDNSLKVSFGKILA
jgi:hypothetical protein